jgi:FlaA1/EpsC-like NDP-sugar epimerase
MKNNNFFIQFRWPLVFLAHIIAICFAYGAAYFLQYPATFAHYNELIITTLPLIFLIKIIIFYFSGLFHVSFRHISFDDILHLFNLNSAASLVSMVVVTRFSQVPITVMIIDWGICFGLLALLRISYRLCMRVQTDTTCGKQQTVLIVGAGEAGIIVLNEYRKNPKVNAHVAAFCDDDRSKHNLKIHGVKVYGSREAIPEIVRSKEVDEIVIAIPSAKGEEIRSIISYCQIPGVKLKIVPGLYKIITDEMKVSIRDVKPEDLLGRETVKIDESSVHATLTGKNILITGAAGSIGSELTRQIASYAPQKIILIDYNENDLYFLERELQRSFPDLSYVSIIGDIKNIPLLKKVFAAHRPQVVFHAAAFKHVPLMEANPYAVVENNIIATRNLIYAAHHYKAEKFIFISSDKAVNPTSIMGASKRIGEMLLQAKAQQSKTRFMGVRFGNVLGSKGSVVPLFLKQIEQGGPVTVMHPDVKRYFMSIREAVQLVLQSAVLGSGGELFILDMGEQIRIIDLANDLITLAGLRPGIDIEIECIGLRPGEKMYEELWLNKEEDAATKHDKIFIAHPYSFDIRKLNRTIRKLQAHAQSFDDTKIIEKIREIVPAFNRP